MNDLIKIGGALVVGGEIATGPGRIDQGTNDPTLVCSGWSSSTLAGKFDAEKGAGGKLFGP